MEGDLDLCFSECVCKDGYIREHNFAESSCVPATDCPLECPGNSYYEPCSFGCEATCEDPFMIECRESNQDRKTRLNGCQLTLWKFEIAI